MSFKIPENLSNVASSSGKLPSTNLRFGSTAEFVCALAEALPNLLPKELSALFSQFQCEFFDAPVTKLKAVIKALEVLKGSIWLLTFNLYSTYISVNTYRVGHLLV